MEGGGSRSDDDDFQLSQRKRPRVVKKKNVAGASNPTAEQKTAKKVKPTPAPLLPTPDKLLTVEKAKHPLAPLGQLNPAGTEDKEKRKLVTATSSARDDPDFQPVQWSLVAQEEDMEVKEERRLRDGRGINIKEGDLADEFQIKYVVTPDSRVGRITKGEGVDLIKRKILELAGAESTSSAGLNVDEASPELILTQEDVGLVDEQRELLFTEIFKKGGRVPVIDKPGWSLIIHKAPTTGFIHLCVEKPKVENGVGAYQALRLCTEPKCYQYQQTLATDVLPKCTYHQPEPVYTVVKVPDYNRRDVLVQLHMKFALSVKLNVSDEQKDDAVEFNLGRACSRNSAWFNYCATKGLKTRPIPKPISMTHFANEGDALKKLSLESTIGMFMKLAPGTQPIINLNDLIPLCYDMKGELDVRLKDLGMELKIRRHLTPEERVEVKYLFPGEYFLTSTFTTTPTTTTFITTATAAAALQKPGKGKSFLYAIMSRNMWYFGWSDTPDFKDRLTGNKSDGVNEYKRITDKRQKDRELEIDGLRQRDRELGRAEESCTYPPPLKAPTLTCYLLAKCDDDDKEKKKTKTIEAKMIIAGYVAYLLGLRNPIRPNSDLGYSTNKCVSISLVDSTSWGEICDFVKLFWGVEPMLGQFKKD
ncbi:uncharacterized protein LOC110854282 [Folsomia candida]|uniref:Uncharacterized protein n=1 Tax=Folsomia candida TaxID=158441 RepID=A0A226DYE6_FOLCA|nr:uncharacterized protein LOC110854282 [Folsomia candida]OXA50482.1 hypothetical protein Fcan01_14697 [Folsomia candida]